MHESNPVRVAEAAAQTLGATGVVTAPADNADIASIPAPPAGLYKVTVTVSFAAGAPAAPEDVPVSVALGAATGGVPLTAARALNVAFVHELYMTCDGVGALVVQGNGAATAAVVYVVGLLATRVA